MRYCVTRQRVRVDVGCPIDPCPLPRRLVDQDQVLAPDKPVFTPPPLCKSGAQRHAKTESNCCCDNKAWTWSREYSQRIIVGNDDEIWIYRQNFYIWAAAHDHLRVRLQVAETPRFLAHSLDGIHHVGAQHQERITNLLRPREI